MINETSDGFCLFKHYKYDNFQYSLIDNYFFSDEYFDYENTSKEELSGVKKLFKNSFESNNSKKGVTEEPISKYKMLKNYYIKTKPIDTPNLSNFYYSGFSLGEGYFGKVELVKHKTTNQLYALKVLKKSKIKEKKNFEHILSEINNLKNCNFPFILKIFNTFQDEKRLFIVTEFVEGGDLMKIISKEKKFSEKTIKFILAQLLLCIDFLHSKNIVYRDIKPENVLIDLNGYLKLADFGLSKNLNDLDDTTKTFCGTPEFLPPEILSAEPYGKAVDIWSFGIMMYELYYGCVNF